MKAVGVAVAVIIKEKDAFKVSNQEGVGSMYKRILVGVDGSNQSDHAFSKALSITGECRATLIIGHVLDIRNFPNEHMLYAGELWDEWKGKADAMLARYKEQAEAAGIKTEIAFASGNPRIQVAKTLTKEHGADLLITSATGRNRMERFFTGSVAEASIRHAPCDYLMVKDYETASPYYKTILVGVDGSDQAEDALSEAAWLAKQYEAALTIVHVEPIGIYTGGAMAAAPLSYEDNHRLEAERMLTSYKQKAKESGVSTVKTEYVHGNPRAKLSTDLPESLQADLLVCGATGTNTVTRLMIGSVAEAAMRHAPCDVLMVKRDNSR